MKAIPAKLTAKYQATVPKEIREVLNLVKGDGIVYEILNDKTVIIRKAYPLDVEYLSSLNKTLNEWMLAEDEQAYRDL